MRRPAPQALQVDGLAVDRYDAVVLDAPAAPPLVIVPLVIVHGAMDRAAGFRRTAVHLPERAVVAYDRRGYAGSIALGAAPELDRHIDDLGAVAAEAAAWFGAPPLLVGHSMGGLIALHALARPGADERFAGAVVWEAPTAWQPWYGTGSGALTDLPPAEAAEAFMRTMIGDRLWERIPERMRQERRAEGPALLADIRQSRQATAEPAYHQIELPVLLGYGDASSSHHRRSITELAAALPRARLTVVPDADHGIHLQRPAAFAELIRSWG